MTNCEIVDAYYRHKKKKRGQGEKEDIMPLLPFFIMDMVYQLYCKDIKELKCRFEMQKIKKDWQRCYNRFNKDFFSAFNEEQIEYIVDKMDSLSEFMQHHLIVLKVAIKDYLKKYYDGKEQEIISTCLSCHVLAQAAQIIWSKVYINSFLRGEEDTNIHGIIKYSLDFANGLGVFIGDDLGRNKRISDSINIVCKKIIQWLNNDLTNSNETNTKDN